MRARGCARGVRSPLGRRDGRSRACVCARRASRTAWDRARVGVGVMEDMCLHACASRTRAIARRGGRGRGEWVIENSCAQGDEVAAVCPERRARKSHIRDD